MNRRDFVRITGSATAAVACVSGIVAMAPDQALTLPTAKYLPRWRGFNLLEKFAKWEGGTPTFRKSDFEWMAEWGFNFARLPMSYRFWTDPGNWRELREESLKDIDAAVELGRQYRIHVNLNFHRAPGYCVNPPKEAKDLWTDSEALEVCALHWRNFAKRYKGIPNDRLSFDLLNEPPEISEATYVRVVERLVEEIRAEDPGRLVIADGLRWGRDPVFGLADLGVGQSTRGYEPFQLTHYKAGWVQGSDKWPEPTWPGKDPKAEAANREQLRKSRIEPWKKLEAKGVGVHVGEWGVFQQTPHEVTLAWMRDVLVLWKEAGWGWALWNFRGSFGVLDSGRKDVAYEDFRGHKLDREMLELLRAN